MISSRFIESELFLQNDSQLHLKTLPDKPKYEIVFVGPENVGKTCLTSVIANGKFINEYTQSAVTSEYNVKKTLQNQEKNFTLVDTFGEAKLRSMLKIFLRKADIVCLVYDITNKKSFEEIDENLYGLCKECLGDKAIYVVIGNKEDLKEKEQVTEEEGRLYAEKIGALFLSTSCLNKTGIDQLFNFFEIEQDSNESSSIKLNLSNEKNKNCCSGSKQRNKRDKIRNSI